MIDTPHITQSSTQAVALIHLSVPRAEIQTAMGPAIREIFATLAAQGIAPTGPWFTHHMHRPNEVFDFDACVPVAQAVVANGRVNSGVLPARKKVARTVYRGKYDSLGNGWGEFIKWIEANGHKAAPDLWECYVIGPEASADPSDWRTELNQPLLD